MPLRLRRRRVPHMRDAASRAIATIPSYPTPFVVVVMFVFALEDIDCVVVGLVLNRRCRRYRARDEFAGLVRGFLAFHRLIELGPFHPGRNAEPLGNPARIGKP